MEAVHNAKHIMNSFDAAFLINTPFQRGDTGDPDATTALAVSRGRRHPEHGKTAEAVECPRAAADTPLKRGVNESCIHKLLTPVKRFLFASLKF